jgi:hypothetical protein
LVEFSWVTWVVSVAAVVISGLVAWLEGNFTRCARLDMGFANHGGMWGDLLLLPIANAAIIPHITPGAWLPISLGCCALLSTWVHIHWYRGDRTKARLRPAALRPSTRHSCEHMWPARRHGSWWRDLSWSGWAHVIYVAGELTVLVGFLLFPMPEATVALVAAIFSLHVPLGLLQPRWFVTGEVASPRKQPLLVPCLAALWATCLMKVV